MANFFGRVDSHMFMRLFVVFNVGLAIYNFLSFRVSPRDYSVPCTQQVLDQEFKLHPSSTNQNQPQSKILSINGDSSSLPQSFDSSNPGTVWLQKRGRYFVLPNYALSNRTYYGNESVTLSTQASASFLNHAETLCRRWQGPVSLAVYVSSGGKELEKAIKIIAHLRLCGHPCIQRNISWHFIMESDATWELPASIVSNSSEISSAKPIIVTLKPGWVPPLWQDLDPESYNCNDTSELNFVKEKTPHSAGEQRKLGRGYPINVVRNVARSLATTHYVLASDIELYTSANIIPRFLKLATAESKNETTRKNNRGPHVYVLPIFEVHKDETPPEQKKQLVELLKKKRAVYFHKWTCDACQNFPGRNTWASVLPAEDSLGVHQKTRRDRSRGSWEPIYIGTNSDPFYEEELSWEGKRDKMSQMFEMCMMGYTMYILDNAFLVHAPGIKTINATDEKRRAPFMRTNNAVYQKTMNRIRKKFPSQKNPC